MVTFNEEILNGKLDFLSSAKCFPFYKKRIFDFNRYVLRYHLIFNTSITSVLSLLSLADGKNLNFRNFLTLFTEVYPGNYFFNEI